MPKKQDHESTAKIATEDQISAGGVAFRWRDSEPEIAIVSVRPKLRWQLPKGIVDPGESPQVTAVREVREEAGIETDMLKLIETIEYWYAGLERGIRVRFHKHVHFYLLEYISGDTRDHDLEVNESRWVPIEDAASQLAFEGERRVVERARELLSGELPESVADTDVP